MEPHGAGVITSLDPDTRHALLTLGRRQPFVPGRTLMAQGDPGRSMMLVESGITEVLVVDPDGHGAFLTFRPPGSLVGEFGVLGDRARCATVAAVTGGWVRVFEAARVRQFLRRHHDAYEAITRSILDKSLQGVERRMRYAVGDPDERIARVLADHARRHGRVDDDGTVIDVPLTYQRIADLVHGSVSSVEKNLGRWKRAGVVETAYRGDRRLRILDEEALRRLAVGTGAI